MIDCVFQNNCKSKEYINGAQPIPLKKGSREPSLLEKLQSLLNLEKSLKRFLELLLKEIKEDAKLRRKIIKMTQVFLAHILKILSQMKC